MTTIAPELRRAVIMTAIFLFTIRAGRRFITNNIEPVQLDPSM